MKSATSQPWFFGAFILAGLLFAPLPSLAGFFEYSLGFNYSRSEYSGGSYSWSRRWGTSLGYNFTDSSTIEASFQDNYDRNHYANYEDSFYDDQVYSVNWVQYLFGKEVPFRPYFKLGVGQLHRKATITNSLGQSQISEQDSMTGVLGAGARISLTQTFGIRIEATSYLTGARISTWQDNIAMSIGGSIYF